MINEWVTPASTPEMNKAMSLYGATMLVVQTFELSLAALVLAVEVGEEGADDPLAEVARLAAKSWRLVHKASAGSMHSRLKGKIADELLREIKVLITWRNFLAHGYLRSRLRSDGRPNEFGAGRADSIELLNLRNAFIATNDRVFAATTAILASNASDQPAAPAFPESSMAELLNHLMFWQPPRFESIETSGSADPD